MTGLHGCKWVILLLCAASAASAESQTFSSLRSLDGPHGATPYYVSLVQGRDGSFYGTTAFGGEPEGNQPSGFGTIFKITPSGSFRTVYNFCTQPDCADGAEPYAGLVLGGDGNLYGTTLSGGAYGGGTVFKIDRKGTLTTLHSFERLNNEGGTGSWGALVQGTDGNLYGTTRGGGTSAGTVFKITREGVFTTLHTFSDTDGSWPRAALVQGTDGNFYGTTQNGGFNNAGTVFKIAPEGKLTTLYVFQGFPHGSDGADPVAPLVQSSDGSFYGTTESGGTYGLGTIFKISSAGSLTTIHMFGDGLGSDPTAPLVQGTDGNFYGTTQEEFGVNAFGTLFKITPEGTLTTLYAFDGTQGQFPAGGLLQGTNGIFYGTTSGGGNFECNPPSGCGTLFSLDVGLGPFVTFVRAAGRVGQTGGVLGQGFTGTTEVSLNGTAAEFTVVSDTYIRATVPAGATSGFVAVTTPTGVLNSSVPFHVIP